MCAILLTTEDTSIVKHGKADFAFSYASDAIPTIYSKLLKAIQD